MKKILVLFALFAQVVAAQTVPNYVPTNGLVGWWPFNGNANDLSGNGKNATSTTATFTQDRNSFQNAAIQLGTGIVQLPQTVFNYNYSSTFTFGCWFTHNASGNDRLVSTECPEGNFRIANWGGNGVFATQFGSYLSYIVDTLINPTQWNHYIFTYSNRNSKVYLNGILVSNSYNNSNDNLIYCNPFTIGAKASQTNVDLWDGKIDDIGIWNRALTPAEIQSLYLGCNDTLAQNPASTNATLGTNTTFTALSSASGATYQWQAKNGSNFVNVSNAGQFSGATSSTLTINSVTSANNGLQVRCIVDHGDCVDTSAVAVLSSCFAINSQPTNQYVVPSSSATFAVSTNDPSCTYQWQTNAGFGFQNLSNAGQFSGVTSATLSVSGVSQANNNQLFRCLVSAGTCLDTTASAKIILSGVGVSENSLQRVSVSPNPTRGSVDLGVALEGTYTLVGIDGRAVQTGSIRQVLDFSNQPAGVYSLRLETAAGSRVLKVVKE